MKTLYVSDLDGTLLRSSESISEFAAKAINSLVGQGMLFTYATARSVVTAKKVTKGISAEIPVIVYNGAMVVDNATGKILISNFFDHTVHYLLDDLAEHGIYPIVYSFVDGKETFSFIPEHSTMGMNTFLTTREGDPRRNEVDSTSALHKGDIFYITCIDEGEKLKPLYEKYKNTYRCLFQKDIYINEQMLEIMPRGASKSNAAKQVCSMLGCNRLVAFGDAENDMDLFRIADECYAVANAGDKLKKYADGVIGSNDEDGVAEWLLQNVKGDID